jgi:predicted RNA-binding protein
MIKVMCQATVYLDGHEVMRDVLRVEPTPEGIRLYAFFEEPRVIPAAIDEIDLINHRIILVSGNEETVE